MHSFSSYFSEASDWIIHFAPHVIGAILLWFAGNWLIGKFTRLTVRIMRSRRMDITLQTFFTSVLSFCLKVLLLISAAGLLGVQTSAFLTAIGAAGLAVGLSLQGSLSNFAGGVLIMTFRPFKIGDIIEAQGQTGVVKEIRILHTLVQTGQKKMVYIPNGILSNGVIVNSSTLGVLVFEIRFDVDRSMDIGLLRSLIMPLMVADPRVYTDPAPAVTIAEIGSGITLAVTGTAKVGDSDSVKTQLRTGIMELLVSNAILHPQLHTFVHQV